MAHFHNFCAGVEQSLLNWSRCEPFIIQEGSDKYYARPPIKAYRCQYDKNTLSHL